VYQINDTPSVILMCVGNRLWQAARVLYIYCMIFRKIITPQNRTITIQLPAEMVGKKVKVIAFETENTTAAHSVSSKEQRLKRIQELTRSSQIDLSNFQFNRDEANNYNETHS
jgi:hypothetical protein